MVDIIADRLEGRLLNFQLYPCLWSIVSGSSGVLEGNKSKLVGVREERWWIDLIGYVNAVLHKIIGGSDDAEVQKGRE